MNSGEKKSSPADIAKVDPNFAIGTVGQRLLWRDAGAFPVKGQAWPSESDRWTRLPRRMQDRLRPPVWRLSRCSAGCYLEFESDSPELAVRWTVGWDSLARDHMPATGASGLDLYEWGGSRWRWAATGRLGLDGGRRFETTFFEKRDHCLRRFRLYLPLYNSLDQLELGVEHGSELRPLGGSRRFVCVYGTSIVQGACASRPGMAYPAIMGRDLAIPVVNLGFSGNAFAEREIAELLAELRPEAFVIDCLPNIQPDGSEEVLRCFLEALARYGCRSPLLFVDFPNSPKASIWPESLIRREKVRRAARNAFDETRGDLPWHWLAGEQLLGDDFEATVDGVHPTDLGFQRMAAGIGEALKRAMNSMKDEELVCK